MFNELKKGWLKRIKEIRELKEFKDHPAGSLNAQLSTLNSKCSTLNAQLSTLNTQRSTNAAKPWVKGLRSIRQAQ